MKWTGNLCLSSTSSRVVVDGVRVNWGRSPVGLVPACVEAMPEQPPSEQPPSRSASPANERKAWDAPSIAVGSSVRLRPSPLMSQSPSGPLARDLDVTHGLKGPIRRRFLLLELLLVTYYYACYLPVAWMYLNVVRAAEFVAVRVCKQAFVWALHLRPVRKVGGILRRVALALFAMWVRRGYVDKKSLPSEFSPSISFAGGGMLWRYYLGVGHWIFENFETDTIQLCASSGGCFAAVPLAMGWDPYEWCKRDWPTCIDHFEGRALGTFFDSLSFYQNLWDNYLPEDAHVRASGRLHLSITLFPSFQNRVVSTYASRAELINCICASACMPIVFLRSFPRTQFGLSIDGGLTNDQPCIDRYTITCSALNDTTDVHPSTPFRLRDTVLIPSLEAVMLCARQAEQDAEKSGAFDRQEWTQLRRRPQSPSESSG